MKVAQKSANRLKNILKQDKEQISAHFLALIKSDIYSVLSSYLCLDLDDIYLSYYVGEDNKYHFDLNIVARNLKKINYISGQSSFLIQ